MGRLSKWGGCNPPDARPGLHAYWDDRLGSNPDGDSPGKVLAVADDILASIPPRTFPADRLKPPADLKPWASESFELAVDRAHGPLEKLLEAAGPIGADDVPADYEARSLDVARERAALAEYRLAEILKATFPADGDGR
jgi:S1/P1 Nuclease